MTSRARRTGRGPLGSCTAQGTARDARCSTADSAPGEVRITRRGALRAGLAGGAALAVASRGLPAWARPLAEVAVVRAPGSRPFPRRPEGAHSIKQVEHIVVVMMENHSFDNILGMLPHRFTSRRNIDGLPVSGSRMQLAVDYDNQNHPVRESRTPTVCPPNGVSNSWDASHLAWNGGANDGFVRASSAEAMTFFDRSDLPFTYSLARQFPVGQRYFCSLLGPTYPNRRFQLTVDGDRTDHDRRDYVTDARWRAGSSRPSIRIASSPARCEKIRVCVRCRFDDRVAVNP
jgi:phospholipase C